MYRGKDPALHRNPIPSVDHNCRAAVSRCDAQSEEGVALLIEEQELHPVLLQQPADVANRFFGGEPYGFARGFCGFHRVPGASGNSFEPKGARLPEIGFDLSVGVEPFGHFGQDLSPAKNPRLGPEANGLKRSDRSHQIAQRNLQCFPESGECTGTRDDGASLDLTKGYPGESRLLGEFLLGQLPVQSEPGDVCGNVIFSSHRLLTR